MEVIQHLESCLVPLLGALDRLSFSDFRLFRVGQVAFSGRSLRQMRLQSLFVVRFADGAAGGILHPMMLKNTKNHCSGMV